MHNAERNWQDAGPMHEGRVCVCNVRVTYGLTRTGSPIDHYGARKSLNRIVHRRNRELGVSDELPSTLILMAAGYPGRRAREAYTMHGPNGPETHLARQLSTTDVRICVSTRADKSTWTETATETNTGANRHATKTR